MADANAGIIVSVGAAISTVIAMLTFWMRLTDRIATAKEIAEGAKGVAEAALQDAAEAKQESREVRALIEKMTLELHDQIDRMGRAAGENNAAIREHITQSLFFVRDNFVRSPQFDLAIKEIKDSQLRTEGKIDELAKQMQAR